MSVPQKRRYKNGLAKVGKYWWICFKREGKKVEKSTGCTLKEDAQLILSSELQRAGFRKFGVEVPDLDDAPALLTLAKEWAEAQGGIVAPRYVEQMVSVVETHLEKWAHIPANRFTTEMLEKARKHYLDNPGKRTLHGISLKTKHSVGGWNRIIRLLSALYGWAIKNRKYLANRPWTAKESKRQKQPRSVVWPEQVQAYLACIDKTAENRFARLSVRMQLGLGLRESETSSARWEWLFWRNSLYMPGLTKNRKTRSIPVPQWLLEELKAVWIEQGRPKSGLVLAATPSDDPLYRGFTKGPVSRAGEALQIHNLHPHRLRATFATGHYEIGTPLSEIQQMMGHEKPQTTMTYIEQRPIGAAEAQAKLAIAFGFSPGSQAKKNDK